MKTKKKERNYKEEIDKELKRIRNMDYIRKELEEELKKVKVRAIYPYKKGKYTILDGIVKTKEEEYKEEIKVLKKTIRDLETENFNLSCELKETKP